MASPGIAREKGQLNLGCRFERPEGMRLIGPIHVPKGTGIAPRKVLCFIVVPVHGLVISAFQLFCRAPDVR